MILRAGSEQGDAANVDLFDGLSDGRGRGSIDRLGKGIEVTDDKGDEVDLLRCEVGQVALRLSSEDACALQLRQSKVNSARVCAPPCTAG